ncbi:hypothetical protein DMJ13_25550 [halophilic archaeon]|nr:hypothetical protein DMJ13_25550 [halophilic archaeon]
MVEAVAQAKGTKPATPLYDMINPDALQALYEQAAPKVSFDYVGYKVTIYPDQTISVSDPEKRNNS